jgi:hypothetical protein
MTSHSSFPLFDLQATKRYEEWIFSTDLGSYDRGLFDPTILCSEVLFTWDNVFPIMWNESSSR